MLNKIANSWAAWPILFFLTFLAAAPGVFNLPSIDRDESRFAQASKEMLEEGDYIRIQYQDSLRNKKPAGIHWMQAGATGLLSDDYKEIWTYRVPSWIGASLAVLATFWCGIVLVGRRAAFIGALLFGASVLLTTEAHISKTDGQLVFWTTLSLAVLARFYMGKTAGRTKALALLFWFAIGVNSLIKGPVGPMVVAFGGIGVWLLDRYAQRPTDQWRGLFWWPGPLLAAMMFVPWFIWIQIATSGQFVKGAVGKDLWDKFFTFSEGHGGIPGYHLGFMPIMFFPATLFVVPAVVMAWRQWRGRQTYPNVEVKAVRFLVCWVGLTWIFFELLLTKLSHYILPAYPGLALLCGWAAVALIDRGGMRISRWVSLGIYVLGGSVLLAVASPMVLDALAAEAAGDFKTVSAAAVLSMWNITHDFAMFLVWPMVWFALSIGFAVFRKWVTAIVFALGFVFVFGWYMRSVALPTANWAQPTEMVRQSLSDVCGLPQGVEASSKCLEIDGFEQVAHVDVFGYAEPSFLLVLGTQNRHSPQSKIEIPKNLPAVYVFNVEESIGAEALAFFDGLDGYCKVFSSSHYALNYSNGSPAHFIALRMDKAAACAAP